MWPADRKLVLDYLRAISGLSETEKMATTKRPSDSTRVNSLKMAAGVVMARAAGPLGWPGRTHVNAVLTATGCARPVACGLNKACVALPRARSHDFRRGQSRSRLWRLHDTATMPARSETICGDRQETGSYGEWHAVGVSVT
jgi:hypothetical protein